MAMKARITKVTANDVTVEIELTFFDAAVARPFSKNRVLVFTAEEADNLGTDGVIERIVKEGMRYVAALDRRDDLQLKVGEVIPVERLGT